MDKKSDKIRDAVRENYSKVAKEDPGYTGCGCGPDESCCPPDTARSNKDVSANLGYSEKELQSVPEGANMGLGCGNPQAIASIKEGEVVLDLGSGGGFDAFLAARQTGSKGKVIGVDMTPDMISKARRNAIEGNYKNVDFRLGEIEHLPVPDNSVDVIISNCVINLSPEKQQVYDDAFRVLKPGGRLAVSDVITTTELPEKIKNDMRLYTGCVSGASTIDEQEKMLKNAGFVNIRIQPKDESREFIRDWIPGSKIEDFIVSASIEAVKP